ncbi:hypothetical protein Gotur_018648 [Gossypium turneri]
MLKLMWKEREKSTLSRGLRQTEAFSAYDLKRAVTYGGSRGGNTVAHAMAKEGMKSLEDCFWVEYVHLRAIDLAASDLQLMQPP